MAWPNHLTAFVLVLVLVLVWPHPMSMFISWSWSMLFPLEPLPLPASNPHQTHPHPGLPPRMDIHTEISAVAYYHGLPHSNLDAQARIALHFIPGVEMCRDVPRYEAVLNSAYAKYANSWIG